MPLDRPRIAVLTSGGDAPGMNAAIRSVVRSAIDCGCRGRRHRARLRGAARAALPPAGRRRRRRRARPRRHLPRARRAPSASRRPKASPRRCRSCAPPTSTGLVVIGGDGSYRGAEELARRRDPRRRRARDDRQRHLRHRHVHRLRHRAQHDRATPSARSATRPRATSARSSSRSWAARAGILATYAGLACRRRLHPRARGRRGASRTCARPCARRRSPRQEALDHHPRRGRRARVRARRRTSRRTAATTCARSCSATCSAAARPRRSTASSRPASPRRPCARCSTGKAAWRSVCRALRSCVVSAHGGVRTAAPAATRDISSSPSVLARCTERSAPRFC